MDAYLLCFYVLETTWEDARWLWQANWRIRDKLLLGHLFLAPLFVDQELLFLKEAAWSFRVLPGDVVVSGEHQTTYFLNCLHARLELGPPVTSFPCLFAPFLSLQDLKVLMESRLVLWACAMKFLGGVQCAQDWPKPLHLWFICHGLANWDGDSEVLES